MWCTGSIYSIHRLEIFAASGFQGQIARIVPLYLSSSCAAIMPVMKKVIKKGKKTGAGKTGSILRVSEVERRLMYKLFDSWKEPAQVAEALDRDLSTVARHYKRWDDDEETPKLGRLRI